MSVRVSLHSSADIVALAVGHDEHTVELGIADSLFEGADTVVTVHLVVRSLRLYCGDDIVYLVDYRLIKVVYCLCGGFEGPAVFVEITALNVLRHVFELGVETYHRRVLEFDDSFDKSVKRHFLYLRFYINGLLSELILRRSV